MKMSGKPKHAFNPGESSQKENPEQVEEPQVTYPDFSSENYAKYMRPATDLGVALTYQHILKKKYPERSLDQPTKLREETERMEEEFNKIMYDLDTMKSVKNIDWYQNQLFDDYS